MTVNFLSIIFTEHFLTHVSPNWHFSGALGILYAIKMNIFKRTDWLHYLNIKFNTQFCCIVCKTSWWWFLNFPFFRLFLLCSASSLIFLVLSSANFFAASCSLSCQYQCSSSKKVLNSVIQYSVSFAHNVVSYKSFKGHTQSENLNNRQGMSFSTIWSDSWQYIEVPI